MKLQSQYISYLTSVAKKKEKERKRKKKRSTLIAGLLDPQSPDIVDAPRTPSIDQQSH